MAERVELLLVVTGVAAAEVVVRRIDAGSFTQQGVNYLIFLAVCCEDQRGNVVREPVGTKTQLELNFDWRALNSNYLKIPYMGRDYNICDVGAALNLISEDITMHIPRPVLIVGIEVIQHVCLSRTCSEATGIPELRVRQQGLGDTNVAFTYNKHK